MAREMRELLHGREKNENLAKAQGKQRTIVRVGRKVKLPISTRMDENLQNDDSTTDMVKDVGKGQAQILNSTNSKNMATEHSSN